MDEYENRLHAYLDEQGIYKSNLPMQENLINSFYQNWGENNNDKWEEKVAFIMLNLTKFFHYASESWSRYKLELKTEIENLVVLDLAEESATTAAYKNLPLALVNDHVMRLAIMTQPYFWHYHPNSDESFLVIEGILVIELEDQTIELKPNQLFNIPKGVIHRSRPKGERSVNLTFESADIKTVRV